MAGITSVRLVMPRDIINILHSIQNGERQKFTSTYEENGQTSVDISCEEKCGLVHILLEGKNRDVFTMVENTWSCVIKNVKWSRSWSCEQNVSNANNDSGPTTNLQSGSSYHMLSELTLPLQDGGRRTPKPVCRSGDGYIYEQAQEFGEALMMRREGRQNSSFVADTRKTSMDTNDCKTEVIQEEGEACQETKSYCVQDAVEECQAQEPSSTQQVTAASLTSEHSILDGPSEDKQEKPDLNRTNTLHGTTGDSRENRESSSVRVKAGGTVEKTQSVGSIRCLMCGKIQRRKNNLLRHVRLVHFTSREEYFALGDSSELQRQEMLEQSTQRQKVKSREAYEHRYNKSFKEREMEAMCVGCGEKFSDTLALEKHVCHTHQMEENFQEMLRHVDELRSQNIPSGRSVCYVSCPYCSASRPGRTALVKHMRLCHAEEPTIERHIKDKLKEIAEIQRKTRRKLERDRNKLNSEKGEQYGCRYCNRKYRQRSSKYGHEKVCVRNPERVLRVECGVCGSSFSSREELVAHKAQHPDKNFICDLCGRGYKNRGGIVTHMRSVHAVATRAAIKYYTCEECGKKYYEKHRWQRHLLVHKNERVAGCELCGKRFKKAEDVRRHKRCVHDNQYPYHCPSCGHGVNRRAYLKTHVCGRVKRVQPQAEQAASDKGVTLIGCPEEPDVLPPYPPHGTDSEVTPLTQVSLAQLPGSVLVDVEGNDVLGSTGDAGAVTLTVAEIVATGPPLSLQQLVPGCHDDGAGVHQLHVTPQNHLIQTLAATPGGEYQLQSSSVIVPSVNLIQYN